MPGYYSKVAEVHVAVTVKVPDRMGVLSVTTGLQSCRSDLGNLHTVIVTDDRIYYISIAIIAFQPTWHIVPGRSIIRNRTVINVCNAAVA